MIQSIARAAALVAAFACSAASVAAQTPAAQPQQPAAAAATIDQAIEQLRKDARTEINALIGANMQFTSDEAATFWPLYKAYEARRKPLVDERLAILKDYAQNYQTMADAKATELMQRALALEGKMASAKREFLAELQKALPPKTVARFYQVHTRVDTLIDLMMAQQVPLVQ